MVKTQTKTTETAIKKSLVSNKIAFCFFETVAFTSF